MARQGTRSATSTSNTTNSRSSTKNRIERGVRADCSVSNPHSKPEAFSRDRQLLNEVSTTANHKTKHNTMEPVLTVKKTSNRTNVINTLSMCPIKSGILLFSEPGRMAQIRLTIGSNRPPLEWGPIRADCLSRNQMRTSLPTLATGFHGQHMLAKHVNFASHWKTHLRSKNSLLLQSFSVD
jgi:hypothetical protein